MAENQVIPEYKSDYQGGYPNDGIAPDKKDYDWHLKAGKALYLKQRNALWLNSGRRLDYITNRLYADGNQDTTRYVDKIAVLEERGQAVSYRDLDWGITSTAPKLINAILGYWEKLDYDIFFDCINPLAAEDRKFIEASIQTKIILKDFNEYVAKMAGIPNSPPVVTPEKIEEMQAFLKDGFRLPYEMEMELGVQMVQEESDWKLMRRQLRREFIINGAAFAKIYVDRISQRVKMRQCDLANLVIEDFYGQDGDASKGIGEVVSMYIYEARLEWGDQFTDKEYYEMAKSAVGQDGNPLQLGLYSDYVNTDSQFNFYRPWDNFKINVLDFEIYSSDRIMKEVTTKKGYVETYHRESDAKTYKRDKTKGENIYSEEVRAVDIKTVRGGKWVINTDFMADWGKKHDIARPNENKRECYREFKLYRAANKSILELVLPLLDQLQLAVLNKANDLSRAIPPGWKIEMGAFENVLMDGKLKNSEELFTMANETGNIIYRQKSTIDDEGHISQANPVEWIDRDIMHRIQGWWFEIDKLIKMIQVVSGINEMMDATTPNADQPVQTAEMALQGAENSLSPMIQGMINMHEKMAYTIMLKLQVIAQNGKIEGYATLGDGFKQLITLGKDISTLSYATRVQALPTAKDKAAIMQMAQEAVNSNLKTGEGGLDPADYIKLQFFLNSGGNLKLAYFMLNQSMDKARAKAQQDKQAADKANTDRLIESAKAAEEEKRKTAEQDHKFEMEKIDRQGMWKMKEIEETNKEKRSNILVDKETDKRVNEHAAGLEQQKVAA